MLYPKTIRFDQSDEFVFEQAAHAGELAVSGAFAFVHTETTTEDWSGKVRQAFANGFLGTDSFGWSTFVTVAEIREDEYEAMVDRLATHFLDHYGAPDVTQAAAAAQAEAEFAAGLCEHGASALLRVERDFGDDGIVERFKVIERPQRDVMAGRVWDAVEDNDGA